jgi:hypothetical protein
VVLYIIVYVIPDGVDQDVILGTGVCLVVEICVKMEVLAQVISMDIRVLVNMVFMDRTANVIKYYFIQYMLF